MEFLRFFSWQVYCTDPTLDYINQRKTETTNKGIKKSFTDFMMISVCESIKILHFKKKIIHLHSFDSFLVKAGAYFSTINDRSFQRGHVQDVVIRLEWETQDKALVVNLWLRLCKLRSLKFLMPEIYSLPFDWKKSHEGS